MKSLHDIRDLQKTILEDCGKSAKNEERYCRLCGKREKRSVCGYGPAGWDKYSVKDATDAEKEAAAEDAGIVEEETLHEVAPPSAKAERMVKHIKKGYSKDGKLTDKEKSIAYATAWKHHNKKEEVEHAGDYKGPLYAPHPDLAKKRKELGLDEGAAWTKKSGKNKEGGLNEKGRKSYERENPGSDLKAPSKKVGNPRRASFCARMKGMKKKLTSKKTASDPDSRINKSLRKWNC